MWNTIVVSIGFEVDLVVISEHKTNQNKCLTSSRFSLILSQTLSPMSRISNLYFF